MALGSAANGSVEAARALIGYGTMNLATRIKANPDARRVKSTFHFVHRTQNLDVLSEELCDRLVKGVRFVQPTVAINVPISREWLPPGDISRAIEACSVDWGSATHNVCSLLPTLHLQWDSIPSEGIKPFSGSLRFLAITKAIVRIRETLFTVRQELARWSSIDDERYISDDEDAYQNEDHAAAPEKIRALNDEIASLQSASDALLNWPVALYDNAIIGSLSPRSRGDLSAYLGRSTQDSIAGTNIPYLQSCILGQIMHAINEECTKCEAEHVMLANTPLWEGGKHALSMDTLLSHARSFDVSAIVDEGGHTLKDRAAAEAHLRRPETRIALGFMSSFGNTYASRGLITGWLLSPRMAPICGHIVTYITYMIPNLAAITSTDTINFIRGSDIKERDARREWRRTWFHFRPGGIYLWTSTVMRIIDQCFSEAFLVNGAPMADYGNHGSYVYRNRFEYYRKLTMAKLHSHWSQVLNGPRVFSVMSRLAWYLSKLGRGDHFYLPLPSPLAVWSIGEYLLMGRKGLLEFQRAMNPLPHWLTPSGGYCNDSAFWFYDALLNSHQLPCPRSSTMTKEIHLEALRSLVRSVSLFVESATGLDFALSHYDGPIANHATVRQLGTSTTQLPWLRTKALEDPAAEIEGFLRGSGVTPAGWKKLVSEIKGLRESNLSYLEKDANLLGQQDFGPGSSVDRLTRVEKDCILAALDAVPQSLTNTSNGERDCVCAALAAMVVFNRGPGKHIYTTNVFLAQVRERFQKVLRTFTVNSEVFLFPDRIRLASWRLARDNGVQFALLELDDTFSSIGWAESLFNPQDTAMTELVRSAGLQLLQTIRTTVLEADNSGPQDMIIA